MRECNFTEGPAGSPATAQEKAPTDHHPVTPDATPLTTRFLAYLENPKKPPRVKVGEMTYKRSARGGTRQTVDTDWPKN